MSGPVGPYAPAVVAGQWLVCSGQIGLEPSPYGPKLVDGGFLPQVQRALFNVGELLKGRRLSWTNVVKATVYLTDMADYEEFNEAYMAVLGRHRPARSLVAVAALPLGALVEIEVWAFMG